MGKRKNRNLFFVGDLHGDLAFLANELIENKYCNSDVICCGDIGVGFKGFFDFLKEKENWFKELKDSKVKIYCLRGNHDNPQYFNGDSIFPENPNFDVILCNDYDILELDKANVLCVGGGFSTDIKWRKSQHTKDRPLYWEGEMPKFNSLDKQILFYELEKCIKNSKKKFIIASHSAPVFCIPHEKWRGDIEDDECIRYNDLERAIMSRLYYSIRECLECFKGNFSWDIKNVLKGKKIDWFYGHFHESNLNQKYLIDKFHGLGIRQIVEFPIKSK